MAYYGYLNLCRKYSLKMKRPKNNFLVFLEGFGLKISENLSFFIEKKAITIKLRFWTQSSTTLRLRKKNGRTQLHSWLEVSTPQETSSLGKKKGDFRKKPCGNLNYFNIKNETFLVKYF